MRRSTLPGPLSCALALGVLVAAGSSPAGTGGAPSQRLRWGDVVDRVDVATPAVALTFDDGPAEPYTSQILDALRDQGVHATFFLIGENARRYPDLVRRIRREGHAIGNHSWSHRDFADLGPSAIDEEIVRTDDVIERLTGMRPVLLRPPYGSIPRGLTGSGGIAARSRHLVVTWSLEVRDWARPGATRIAIDTLRAVRPGSIVLLHDGGGDRSGTATAVRWMVGNLSKRGFDLVTLPELLERAR